MVGNSYKSRKYVSGYLSLRRVNSKCSDFGWILGIFLLLKMDLM